MNFSGDIQKSIRYLSSEEASQALRADAYWPKWNSPWWHMLVLHEMGETKTIPEKIIREYMEALQRIPLKIFPIYPEEMPDGIDPYRGASCHCQLGNIYQVLAEWGVDVDRELPWIRPWFLRYQMLDGGMSCDNEAYLVAGECPSSMVGTIAAFEAILKYTPRAWTPEEMQFLERAAGFLIGRKLIHGSNTKHNAEEQISAKEWTKLCFPRLYLYDILRGLSAILLWAEKSQANLPREAIADAVRQLQQKFPDGKVIKERLSYSGKTTILQTASGDWIRQQPASSFPLLEKVSALGEDSHYLSQQWIAAKQKIRAQVNLRELLS